MIILFDMKHVTAENGSQKDESGSSEPSFCLETAGKAKILIVEDDTPLAMMMVHVLSRVGCDVQVANTGEKGMELALSKKFALITLDVDLPGLNGFQIYSELKQRHFSRHTPVVFVSGRATKENRQYAFELGAVDFIEKPFGTEFASRLLSHLNSSGALDVPDKIADTNAEGLCNSTQRDQ